MTRESPGRPDPGPSATNHTHAFDDNASRTKLLRSEAFALLMLQGASVAGATDIGTYAVEAAASGLQVFPLRGKIPAIRGGRGVLDATADLVPVTRWWGGDYAGCNIGVRVPDSLFVLDFDPRNGGTKAAFEAEHAPLPRTLTTVSGRRDGGMHLFYRHPGGKLSSARLGAGIDVKTSTGYVVWAPSIHPDTGYEYVRFEYPVADPPAWLVDLVRVPDKPTPAMTTFTGMPMPPPRRPFVGPSIADDFTATTSWSSILEPHGWTCCDADGDADGARWVHPRATSASSATVQHGCLFVWSPNTPFEPSESGDPHGYTKFRAYAILNHNGDMSATAQVLQNRDLLL